MFPKRIFQAARLLVLFSLLLGACAPQAAVSTSTPAPLTGQVTRAAVAAAPGWEKLTGGDYTPDTAQVAAIQAKAADVKVLLFMGTWCGDSKREVPHFFKLMDAAGIPENQVEIIALDRSKKDTAGLTEQWSIKYVPTFIFTRGGKELGRIIEKPEGTLEANIATILAQ